MINSVNSSIFHIFLVSQDWPCVVHNDQEKVYGSQKLVQLFVNTISIHYSYAPFLSKPLLSSLWNGFLISVILSTGNLSQVLSVDLMSIYLCISLCLPAWDSLMPLSLWYGGIQPYFCYACSPTTVCSHPLKFIYPNIPWLLETVLTTGYQRAEAKHTFMYIPLYSMWCTVVCVSPWKQLVQQCSHTAVHWFTTLVCSQFVVGFGSVSWRCRAVTIHSAHCCPVCQDALFLKTDAVSSSILHRY